MPLKTGLYTMTFMINTGEPPFPTSDATLNITATSPSLSGTISVPTLGIANAPILGTSADSAQGVTTFNFNTTAGTPQLEGYGMQIVCGTEKKLMGGANIINPPGLPGGDPNQDACWLATHSVGDDGDGDDDDKRGKGKYGR